MYHDIITKQRLFFNTGITLSPLFRKEQLKKLRSAIQAYSSRIETAVYSDFRKSKFEVDTSEIAMTLLSVQHAIKNVEKWSKPKKVRSSFLNFRSNDAIYPEPYGVSLLISPWNYPFLLAIDPLIAAISAGNCVVLKLSEQSPATSNLIQQMLESIFNPEYITVVQGEVEVSKQLLDLRFDKIFFTGSTQTGKAVYEAASKFLTPVTLELGGKSPCIVSESADLTLAAKRILWGKMTNAGQTCIAPDYLLVHKNIKDQLLQELVKTLRLFYGENIANNPDFPRIINEKHYTRLESLLSEGEIIEGGKCNRNDLYISPTIIDKINWDHQIMKDEIFGPILPILVFDSIDEVVNKLNQLEKPLALYIFSNNKQEINIVLRNCSFGGGCVNDTLSHLLNPRLPFGGVGNSGMGSYHGKYGFDTFSHYKSIVRRAKWPDLSLRYPPYQEKTVKMLHKYFKFK